MGEGINGAAGFGLQECVCPVDASDANPQARLHPLPQLHSPPVWGAQISVCSALTEAYLESGNKRQSFREHPCWGVGGSLCSAEQRNEAELPQ